MSELPEDTIIEILSWLPVKSLIRFKCACKPWYSLISDRLFAKLHLRRAKTGSNNNSNRLLLSSWPPLSVDYESFENGDNGKTITELNYPSVVKGPPCFFYVTILGSCDGLICFVDKDENMVLWNPTTRDYRELPKPSGNVNFHHFYGLGFNSSIDDYQVVFASDHALDGSKEHIIELFTLETNSWERIQDDSLSLLIERSGTFWNGALYWLGWKEGANVIVSFGMEEKKFKKVLQAPDHLNTYRSSVQLGISETGLCLFCTFEGSCFEVFLVNGAGDEASWNRLFSYPVDRFSGYWYNALCLSKNGEVVFDFDGWRSALYDPKERTMRFLTNNRVDCDSAIFVESIVSPNYD